MKRRTVLKSGVALGLGGAVGVPTLDARADVADLDLILTNFERLHTGVVADQSDPNVAKKVAAISSTAARWLAIMADPTTLPVTTNALFKGITLGTAEASLTTTFSRLADIALATVTPNAAQFGDAALQRRVLAGLDWVHRAWYGDQSRGYYGNWFHWEIGQPTQIMRALVFARAELDAFPGLLDRLVDTMDAYLRNGKDGDIDLDSRFHTGANLADVAGNRILQGALLGDEARVAKAVADRATVFATIDPHHIVHGNTDGYYADGSFIQHHSVAYTGAYGKVLLARVVSTLKTLDGTSFEAPELAGEVQEWLARGFAPLIYEGYMMEVVKGRSVTNVTTGYADVIPVIEAAVDVARYLGGADAAAMLAYAKYLATVSRATVDPVAFVSPATIVAYDKALADTSVVAANLLPASAHVTFNAMERDVHLRPGWALAVARSSSRISKYEYMSGQNLMPWFQGDGASYLYLTGEDQTAAFGVDYYATVGAYALSGVTAPVERRLTVPEAYGGELWYENPTHPLNFTSSSVSQNTYVYFPLGTNQYSAGLRLDRFGSSGLVLSDDVAWRDRTAGILPDDFAAYPNARGHKSIFMFDDEVVVLAAGVRDPAGRAVTSTIESRCTPPLDEVAIAGEGVRGTRPVVTGRHPWLRWSNATTGSSVGYVVLAGPTAAVTNRLVRVPRSVVRTNNPGIAERRVVSLGFEQVAGDTGSFSYVVLPGADEASVVAAATTPSVSVIRNDATVQAVEHTALGLTGMNFFAPGACDRVSAAGPAAVMLQKLPRGGTRVALSDPIRTQSELVVTLHGRLTRVSGDAAISVTYNRGETTLVLRATDGIGQTYTVDLRPGG